MCWCPGRDHGDRGRLLDVRASPSTAAMEALFRAMVATMSASGWSDAGTRLPGWLGAAGFDDVVEGERPFWWQGSELAAGGVLRRRRGGECARGAKAGSRGGRGGRAPRGSRRPAQPPSARRRRPRQGLTIVAAPITPARSPSRDGTMRRSRVASGSERLKIPRARRRGAARAPRRCRRRSRSPRG